MTDPAWTAIRVDEHDGVLVVTLNRPHALNAFDAHMHTELLRVLRDSDLASRRALVITGAGRAFSAGGDLKWFTKITPAEVDRLFDEGRELVYRMLDLDIPVVAAVNGVAAGLGATLALLCDAAVLAESASIGDPHVRIGVAAGDGGTVIWPWLIGMTRAKEALLLGELIPAERALAIGLVNRVVPDERVLPAAVDLARQFAAVPPLAFRGTKRALNAILRHTAALNFETCLAAEKECFGTDQHRRMVEQLAAPRPSRPA